MVKKVFLKDLKNPLNELKLDLKSRGFDVKLIGGLKERGYTTHDIDLDISMPHTSLPDEKILSILSDFGYRVWEEFGLELDINFWHKRRKLLYKMDKDGVYGYREDGDTLLPL